MTRPFVIPIPGFRPDQVGSVGRTVVAANTAEAVRNAVGLGTANSPTFAGGTFNGTVHGTYVNLGNNNFGRVELLALGDNFPAIQMTTSFGQFQSQILLNPGNGTTDYRSSSDHRFLTLGSTPQAILAGQAVFHGTVQVRNGISEIHKTYTSPTNNEALRFNAAALNGADPECRIEIAAGSAGGVVRPLRIGGTVGTTFTPWLSISESGIAAFSNRLSARSRIDLIGDGGSASLQFMNSGGSLMSIISGIESPGAVVTASQPNDIAFRSGNGFIFGLGSTPIARISSDGRISAATATLTSLPTSDPAVAGALWRSGNDVKISTG